MINFKKGDKVRCVDASSGNLRYGEIYTVEKYDEPFVYLCDKFGGHFPSRFELVETKSFELVETKKLWLVTKSEGEIKDIEVYHSRKNAEYNASLSASDGSIYYVFEAVSAAIPKTSVVIVSFDE